MKRVAILYTLALAILIAAADMGYLQSVANAALLMPWVDEAGHFVLMGLLALVLNIVLRGRRIELVCARPRLGSLIALTLVVAEELSQMFLATRRFSISDLVFDLAGIAAFGVLYAILYIHIDHPLPYRES
jgi:VanZ family protein